MKFILLLVLLSCLPALSDIKKPKVIGSHEPIEVKVGDNVTLPCHLEPPFNVTSLRVFWKHNGTPVHVCLNKVDDFSRQHENFINRTLMFHDEMHTGNISLKLTNVSERDAGNYTCYVPSLESQVKKGKVTLIVVTREESNKGNQTDNFEPKSESKGPGRHHFCIIGPVILLLIAIIVLVLYNKRRCNSINGRRQSPEASEENNPETENLNAETPV